MSDAFTTARQRIAAAYDPQFLDGAGRKTIELVVEHLTRVQAGSGKVLNWNLPAPNVAAAEEFLRGGDQTAASAPPDFATAQERFARLVRSILDRGQNLHHPHYIGHQVPASVPLAGLFDAIASITNQVMAIYEMGPWATAVEAALVERIGVQVGLGAGEFAGHITHGGSLANLTALLTARNVVLGESWETGVRRDGPPPVLVVHAEAHYCLARSAGILGLGTQQVIKAALDERRRIDPQRLDQTLTDLKRKGHPIVAVAACACATPIGAFDPLNDIADVCQRHGVWLHVDAAHGGAAAFSPTHRPLLAGLERADSFIIDAHKMMFVPALCAFVFYRNRDHRYEAFQQDAPYLFDPSAPDLADFDVGLRTVECTKRAAAYGLWGIWSIFGTQLFADLVDLTFGLGRRFYEMLLAAPDFDPLHEPQCNIVVFRHVPDEMRDAAPQDLGRFQLTLRRQLIESGRFYIVPTSKDGIAALRVTVINPLTTEADLTELLTAIREAGATELRKAQ